MKTLTAQRWPTQTVLIPPSGRSDLAVEELDEEIVLSDPRNGHVYRLNSTAAEVWRLCDGRRTTARIAERLTEMYEVSLDSAMDHVEQITARFGDAKLIEGDA